MKCIHHIDADGYCAAAIVASNWNEVFMPSTEEDFIPYNHGWDLKLPEADKLRSGEQVFIVDLALDDTIFKAIKYFVEHGCDVIHIDHHIGGRRYYEKLSLEDKAVYDSIIHFFNTDYSGTMLTWVYSCMNPDEQKDPSTVEFDFSEKFTHVGFWFNTPNFREYAIPMAVRYIDDNDVWRHSLEESKYFAMAFNMEENKTPINNKLWDDLLYSSTQKKTIDMVQDGTLLYKYQASVDKENIHNAFEYYIAGIRTLCLNTCYGNSRIFGEKIEEYPMVCKFSYDGSIGKWRYAFYSHSRYADNVDCAKIASEYFNGGGHKASAAGMLDNNFFEFQASESNG
mgnify:FL=1